MSPARGLKLSPDDVLFLRDGKPSSRGTDHYLRSLFPPFPSTLYGALRTRLLMDGGFDLSSLNAGGWEARPGSSLRAEIGPKGGFGTLALRGPWLLQGQDLLLPAPQDLGITLEQTGLDDPPRVKRVFRYRPKPGPPAWSHALAALFPYEKPAGEWVESAEEPRPAESWYLAPRGIAAWRSGGLPAPGDFLHEKELWGEEPRTGVGLEEGRRSGEPGLLYTFGFIRLKPGVALGFDVRGTELAAGGALRLGGEGRTGVLGVGPAFPQQELELEPGDRFSLTFVTPSLSRSGSYPPGFAADSRQGEIAGLACELIGAVVGGFRTVGGWDLARSAPKPLRRALSPGTTFLFEARDAGTLSDGGCLCDYPNEQLALQGFGLFLLGRSE